MPVYVILTKLTEEGRKTIQEKPERILKVNEELAAMGITVKQQFVVTGQYDFVNIIEAKNNDAVMKMSLELGSRGTLKLLSLAAVPAEDFAERMRKVLQPSVWRCA